MSTFDTLCEWREGMRSDTEALLDCLTNLAEWCPVAAEQEAFEGLCEIVLNMRKREDQDYEKEYQRGVSKRFLVPPRYPMPAIPLVLEAFEMAGIPAIGLFRRTTLTNLEAHAFWFNESHPLYSGDPIRF